MPNKDKNWENTKDKASSSDPFDRLAALARSVFYLEHALLAVGIERSGHEGASALLKKSSSILRSEPDCPDITAIQASIDTRNKAVHEGIVPDSHECSRVVQVLFQAWCCTRRKFVTPQTAAHLASAILLKSDVFYKAFLFGSLARNKQTAGDIDLLIFDNGEISFIDDLYGSLRSLKSRTVFEMAGIRNNAWLAAIDSDWIDIVVVHHALFGNDPNYVRSIASSQSPLFLLNISDGIQQYDKQTERWIQGDTSPFKKWADIRKQLADDGVVHRQ